MWYCMMNIASHVCYFRFTHCWKFCFLRFYQKNSGTLKWAGATSWSAPPACLWTCARRSTTSCTWKPHNPKNHAKLMFFFRNCCPEWKHILHVMQYTVYCNTLFVYIWNNWEKPRKKVGNRVKNSGTRVVITSWCLPPECFGSFWFRSAFLNRQLTCSSTNLVPVFFANFPLKLLVFNGA